MSHDPSESMLLKNRFLLSMLKTEESTNNCSLIHQNSNEHHLFEIETFCNIINVLTVTFDQYIVSLLN